MTYLRLKLTKLQQVCGMPCFARCPDHRQDLHQSQRHCQSRGCSVFCPARISRSVSVNRHQRAASVRMGAPRPDAPAQLSHGQALDAGEVRDVTRDRAYLTLRLTQFVLHAGCSMWLLSRYRIADRVLPCICSHRPMSLQASKKRTRTCAACSQSIPVVGFDSGTGPAASFTAFEMSTV